MKSTYYKITECLEMLAEGYRELADANNEFIEEAGREEVSSICISTEDIRNDLPSKIQEVKMKEVRALLLKYDSGRMSGVDLEKYPKLLRDAEVL